METSISPSYTRAALRDSLLPAGILLLFISANVAAYGFSSRVAAYSAALVLVSVFQCFFPLAKFDNSNISKRWSINYVLSFIAIALTGVPPMLAASYATKLEFGVFHVFDVNFLVIAVVGILLLDLLLYSMHAAFHKISIFWRMHKVHHNDVVFDASLIGRDHPFTPLIVGIVRASVVFVLGIPIEICALYLVMLSLSLSFIHGNITLRPTLERRIGIVFVTPRQHFVHHASNARYTDSNYGLIFSFWDRLFGTFTDPYKMDLNTIEIGLEESRDPNALRLSALLKSPFVRENKKVPL